MVWFSVFTESRCNSLAIFEQLNVIHVCAKAFGRRTFFLKICTLGMFVCVMHVLIVNYVLLKVHSAGMHAVMEVCWLWLLSCRRSISTNSPRSVIQAGSPRCSVTGTSLTSFMMTSTVLSCWNTGARWAIRCIDCHHIYTPHAEHISWSTLQWSILTL